MDDPPANTYTHEMMRQLDEAILDARFDSDVEVIVLAGKGEKFFSAGANIGMLNAVTPEFKYMFCLHANETLNRLEQTPKLVIAALNGHTVGGGLEIAMAADIRIARQDAGKIGLPEVALGVLPGTGGTQRLARLVGKSRAIELMVTGKTVSFEQALDWGIVNDIYRRQRRRVSRASRSITRSNSVRPTKHRWRSGTSSAAFKPARNFRCKTRSRSSASCNRCSSRAKTQKKASRRTTKSASQSSRTNNLRRS